MKKFLGILAVSSLALTAQAQELSTVRYLANEGLMVTHGETSVLFDPLYDNGFDTYQVVPQHILDDIFEGGGPYANIAAVFISHYHGDHFSASEMLRLMHARPSIELYAPAQAVSEMRQIADADDEALFERVTQFDLEYGDEPVFIRKGDLLIEAIFIPHSGWPSRRTDVQNIVFRVTLGDRSTVLHMGDADARIAHFEKDEEYWEERNIDLAFPPYWFYLSDDGRQVLDYYIPVRASIGIHVPDEIARDPSTMPDELLGEEIFTSPGEGRSFIGRQ